VHQPGCEECDRLWREYASATVEHVRLESKLRLAALCHEDEKIEALTLDAEQAGITRRGWLDSIRKHEATHDSVGVAQAGRPK